MGPSEDEITARLAELRRRREAIDREIADLMLYLELGRRLRGEADASLGDPAAMAGDSVTARAAAGPETPGSPPIPDRAWPASPPPAPPPDHGRPTGRSGPAVQTEPSPVADGIPPAIAFADDPAGARRYGRALIEAACTVIARAGRPLHAGEILEALLARGFTVPGRDPVAALNTRLWKRAGADGPLRRVGEAVYALEDADPAAG